MFPARVRPAAEGSGGHEAGGTGGGEETLPVDDPWIVRWVHDLGGDDLLLGFVCGRVGATTCHGVGRRTRIDGRYHPWFAGFAADGAFQWVRDVSQGDHHEAHGVAPDGLGGVHVVGTIYESPPVSFYAHFDAEGTRSWQHLATDGGYDTFDVVGDDPNGAFVYAFGTHSFPAPDRRLRQGAWGRIAGGITLDAAGPRSWESRIFIGDFGDGDLRTIATDALFLPQNTVTTAGHSRGLDTGIERVGVQRDRIDGRVVWVYERRAVGHIDESVRLAQGQNGHVLLAYSHADEPGRKLAIVELDRDAGTENWHRAFDLDDTEEVSDFIVDQHGRLRIATLVDPSGRSRVRIRSFAVTADPIGTWSAAAPGSRRARLVNSDDGIVLAASHRLADGRGGVLIGRPEL